MKKIILDICKWIIRKLSKNVPLENKARNNFSKVNINKIIIKKKTKIEPIIYYINVWDKTPDYFECSLKSCKEINPTFKIEVLNYNYDEFFKLNGVWNYLVRRKMDKIKSLSKSQLCDIVNDYKIDFLYKYGGFILSPTTFCARNFNCLLNNNKFIYSHIYNGNIEKDFCFIGSIKQCDDVFDILYPPYNLDKKDYNTMKLSFINNSLSFTKIKTNNCLLQNYVYDFN